MSWLRALAGAALLTVALVLQVSVFPAFTWEQITPNLCLLVVVGAALARGPQFAMVLGFAGGVLLDLAPPADHVAGRWALALVLVGLIAGRVRQDLRPTAAAIVSCVAACSFVGTSVFALSGLVLGETNADVTQMLQVIGISVVMDVLVTPLVLPGVLWVLDRLEPSRSLA